MSGWWDWVESVGKTYSGTITVLALAVGFVAMIFAGLALRPKRGPSEIDLLRDHHGWRKRLDDLNPDWADAWFAGIARFSGFASRLYGERLLSWRAFDKALMIAFLYPIAALLLGWALFDAGRLGESEFLPEGLKLWRRTLLLVAIGLGAGVMYLVAQHYGKIEAAISRYLMPLQKRLDNLPVLPSQAGGFSLRVLAGLAPSAALALAAYFAVAGAGAAAVGVALSVAVAVAVAVCVGVVGAAVVVLVIAGAVGVAAVVAGALTFAGNDLLTPPATVLLFLGFLPILNALADFLSIAATRAFLRHIAPGPARPHGASLLAVLAGVLLDLVIAATCLLGLLWAITAGLDLWAHMRPASLPFDWRAYRASLCAGDLERGTMLWLMLLTTLAPTAVHLATGLGAVLTRTAKIDREIHALLGPAAEKLEAKHGHGVWAIDETRRGPEVLSEDDLHKLDLLYARRSFDSKVVFALLLLLTMAVLVAAVAWLLTPAAATICASLPAPA
ncbi:hypothetical protein GQF56_14980 [Rhodobacter sphaeroides]|jgi:hypothetical protein|uniref:Uncharacterized protein n=2 Tax=Cereibacter sphaeroides TaxID=1063 RepID=Q3J6L2_CERS4|nr:hypothetical protein [Cereibacter sphaeroides]ABA77572.1 hypothetical protein RSP_1430 [Cereibacter sphaeroides 2.4.1]AMJ45977.1 hypothetical protein APX01_00045 [Cereibacter sphaeroides]ATN61741.1 hypothetical protein A3857_00045 [Cereibacter sphaeroides]AXC59822.1 hypothetical protein DQL45_00045 [Cereibacter sphaeroides 2.4.1]MVX49167.1 hypothetical protein [Cereibacter sphaeroides]